MNQMKNIMMMNNVWNKGLKISLSLFKFLFYIKF